MLPSGRFRVLWCLGRSAPWRAHWSALQLDRRFRIRGAFIDRAIRVSRAGPLTRPRTRPRTRTPTLPPTLNRRRVVKLPVRRPQQHRLRRHDRPPLPRRPPRCRRCRRWNRRRMRVANACCFAHHRDQSLLARYRRGWTRRRLRREGRGRSLGRGSGARSAARCAIDGFQV